MVNIHDAKTHFSRLLTRVESGEEIVIAKAEKKLIEKKSFTFPPLNHCNRPETRPNPC